MEQKLADWVTKIIDLRKHEMMLWISKHNIPDDIKPEIMRYIRLTLQEGKDVDIVHLLHVIPFSLGMSIKKHICLPMLKKVSSSVTRVNVS